MQGQLIEQIRGMRIQKSLKEQLVQSIIDKQIDGLIGCLNKYQIDIMACQEINHKYRDDYKNRLDVAGYKLLYNEKEYSTRVYTTVGFIVNKECNIDVEGNSIFNGVGQTNKYYEIKFTKYNLSLVTVHINPKERETCLDVIDSVNEETANGNNTNRNIILLGDFNAAGKEHREKFAKQNVMEENEKFLKKISEKGYIEIGDAKNYTYITANFKNKIDHIYFSHDLNKYLEDKRTSITEHLVNEVEHSSENGWGFCDHNMLWFDIDIADLKS